MARGNHRQFRRALLVRGAARDRDDLVDRRAQRAFDEFRIRGQFLAIDLFRIPK